jgi:hypothetical protein
MKKNRGDEPIWDIILMYMEISQGNSLCSYFYFKMSFFSFILLQNRRTGGWNRSCWCVRGCGTSGRREVEGKRGRRVNIAKMQK